MLRCGIQQEEHEEVLQSLRCADPLQELVLLLVDPTTPGAGDLFRASKISGALRRASPTSHRVEREGPVLLFAARGILRVVEDQMRCGKKRPAAWRTLLGRDASRRVPGVP